MTIVTRSYGGTAIVTWGYGELIYQLISPFSEIVGIKFTKLNSKSILFDILNNTTALMERIIAETSDDLVINPPTGSDLQVIPSVSVLFNGINHIRSNYKSIYTVKAHIDRVISEEPIVQVMNPSGGDLQIIPTVSVFYEKINSIATNHEISNKVDTTFIRVIAEES